MIFCVSCSFISRTKTFVVLRAKHICTWYIHTHMPTKQSKQLNTIDNWPVEILFVEIKYKVKTKKKKKRIKKINHFWSNNGNIMCFLLDVPMCNANNKAHHIISVYTTSSLTEKQNIEKNFRLFSISTFLTWNWNVDRTVVQTHNKTRYKSYLSSKIQEQQVTGDMTLNSINQFNINRWYPLGGASKQKKTWFSI